MSEAARKVGLAALLLGASQLASRGLGVVREMVLAWQVGAGPDVDAYRAAFQLPDLLNHFLAVGAIATAFIPLFQRARERGGLEAAERLFQVVWGTLTTAVVLVTVVLFAGAASFVDVYFADFPASGRALTTQLTRIVLPAQVFFVTGGILRAVLMAEGRFGAQAAAPVLYNLGIIAGGLLGGGVEGFAWGAVAGAGVGHLLVPLLDARGRIRLRMRVAPFDADFRRYLLLALPLLVGVTLVAGDEWLDRYFGQFLGAGAIALLFYARTLMQAPVGLLGQAVGTAALPALASLHEQGRREELSRLVQQGLQTTLWLAVLVAFALAALADPVVRLLYVHGAFSPEDGAVVAGLLVVFCAGIPGWVVQSIAVRPFHARGDTWRPMLLGTVVLVLAVPLYALLGPRLGPEGLAAAGAIAISSNALATLGLARRRHGAPALWPLLDTLLRSAAVGAVAAGAAHGTVLGLEMPAGAIGALLDLALGGAVFVLLGGAGIWMLGDAALRDTLRGIARRGPRSAP